MQTVHQQALGPVMLNVEGLSLCEEDKTLLRHPAVGGLILFTRNFESRQQLTELVESIRSVRPGILIAVDQEGGRVQRLNNDGFTRLPPMQSLRKAYREDAEASLVAAQDLGCLMASEVLALGIDISFAPVLDVDDNFSSIIGDRSFSDQSDEVSALAGAFMQGMNLAGMATTGKHFPGHGAVREDSHLTLPVDPRPFAEVAKRDLAPFKTLLPQLDAVMPAHIIFSAVDPQPVGFSRYWLQDCLRQEMGFDGVIFSDDLSMEGAAEAGSYPERAAAALSAGCDMVLVCNERAAAISVCDSLVDYQVSAKSRERLASMSARRQHQWSSLAGDSQWQKGQLAAEKLLA